MGQIPLLSLRHTKKTLTLGLQSAKGSTAALKAFLETHFVVLHNSLTVCDIAKLVSSDWDQNACLHSQIRF